MFISQRQIADFKCQYNVVRKMLVTLISARNINTKYKMCDITSIFNPLFPIHHLLL